MHLSSDTVDRSPAVYEFHSLDYGLGVTKPEMFSSPLRSTVQGKKRIRTFEQLYWCGDVG